MAKKRIQPEDEEIARRSMNLARQLKGRLFISHDGIHIVRGMPDFHKLRSCLIAYSQPPTKDSTPTPIELGFFRHLTGRDLQHEEEDFRNGGRFWMTTKNLNKRLPNSAKSTGDGRRK